MIPPLLKHSTPTVQLIFSALVVVATWLIFQLLAILSGMLIFSAGMEEALQMMTNMEGQEALAYVKYVQAITSIGLFIVSSLIIAFAIDGDVAGYLLLKKAPGKLTFLLTVFMIILVLPFSNLMTELNRQLSLPESMTMVQEYFEVKEQQMEGIMRSFLNVQGFPALLLNLLIIAVIPALGEELLFRGIFQRLFTQLTKSPHAGIIIAAFVFSALHMQFLSFLPRFVLGIIFGYLVFWSGSLWPAILAHFVNNSLAVIYYHLYYAGGKVPDLENVGAPGHALYLGIISMIATLALLYGIYQSVKEKEKETIIRF